MARTLKQQIRSVIKEYYGDELNRYTRMAGDGPKLMPAFVDALARAIRPGSVLPVECACELINFDGHPSPIDIELGRRIRSLRLQKEVSLESLAAEMNVHPDYLEELEQGKLTPQNDIHALVANALGAPHQWKYLAQDLDETTETEAWIRYAITMHFGRSLWSFHPEVSYKASIDPFVEALVGLDQAGQRAAIPIPTAPSLGDIVES